ncbi:MAG: ABC transporter permease [Lachnospiraceae bacterium]
MIQNIALAFQGIWSHKLRSILTMLGIIIGIASIISIVSTIQGTNEQIKQNLIGAGNNAVNITFCEGDYSYDFDYQSVPDGVPVITEAVKSQIESLDTVEIASLYRMRSYTDNIYHKKNSFSGSVYGIDKNYFSVYGYHIVAGRGFTDTDYNKYRKVVLLNAQAVSALFSNDNPINQTIEMNGEPFVVIGVVEQSSDFEPIINNLSDYYTYNQNTSGTIFMPDSCWDIVYKYDEPQNVALRAISTDDMTNAGKSAAEILNGNLNVDSDSSYAYKSDDLLEQAQQIQSLSNSTNMQLIWIASISLLVGGIGVMNIMLVSVSERTKEIGLKKALGARKGRILFQFLTEAAVLTSLGGLLGVIAGVYMAQIVSDISGTPSSISVTAAVIAVLFSMAIGIIFGLIPAIQAARLNPIDALRRE